jgi:hypothetical protein
MLAGAFAGLMMWFVFVNLQEAWHHPGPGYVSYEEPERTERVSEGQYRRHKLAAGIMFLVLGISVGWSLQKSQEMQAGRRERERSFAARRTPNDPPESLRSVLRLI